MSQPSLQEKNSIFAGLAPSAWRRFDADCSYRWQRGEQQGYQAAYLWQEVGYFVPYRLGYEAGEGCAVRDELEQVMAWCLASRHHDGFMREQALRHLLGCSQYPFVVPYLLRPLSEYVFPIYELLYAHRQSLLRANLCTFVGQNPAFVSLTWQRMRSYWDAYHRERVPNFFEMPNVQFMRWLERLPVL